MDRKAASKIFYKLIDAGFDSEKAIEKLTMEEAIQITGITISDIGLIVQLQKALKQKKLIEFLAGEDEKSCTED